MMQIFWPHSSINSDSKDFRPNKPNNEPNLRVCIYTTHAQAAGPAAYHD